MTDLKWFVYRLSVLVQRVDEEEDAHLVAVAWVTVHEAAWFWLAYRLLAPWLELPAPIVARPVLLLLAVAWIGLNYALFVTRRRYSEFLERAKGWPAWLLERQRAVGAGHVPSSGVRRVIRFY